MLKLFTIKRARVPLVVVAQVISQFATISKSTGSVAYPEPAATFLGVLSVTSLDFLGFIPLGCVFRNASYYDKVGFESCALITAITIFDDLPFRCCSSRVRQSS